MSLEFLEGDGSLPSLKKNSERPQKQTRTAEANGVYGTTPDSDGGAPEDGDVPDAGQTLPSTMACNLLKSARTTDKVLLDREPSSGISSNASYASFGSYPSRDFSPLSLLETTSVTGSSVRSPGVNVTLDTIRESTSTNTRPNSLPDVRVTAAVHHASPPISEDASSPRCSPRTDGLSSEAIAPAKTHFDGYEASLEEAASSITRKIVSSGSKKALSSPVLQGQNADVQESAFSRPSSGAVSAGPALMLPSSNEALSDLSKRQKVPNMEDEDLLASQLKQERLRAKYLVRAKAIDYLKSLRKADIEAYALNLIPFSPARLLSLPASLRETLLLLVSQALLSHLASEAISNDSLTPGCRLALVQWGSEFLVHIGRLLDIRAISPAVSAILDTFKGLGAVVSAHQPFARDLEVRMSSPAKSQQSGRCRESKVASSNLPGVSDSKPSTQRVKKTAVHNTAHDTSSAHQGRHSLHTVVSPAEGSQSKTHDGLPNKNVSSENRSSEIFKCDGEPAQSIALRDVDPSKLHSQPIENKQRLVFESTGADPLLSKIPSHTPSSRSNDLKASSQIPKQQPGVPWKKPPTRSPSEPSSIFTGGWLSSGQMPLQSSSPNVEKREPQSKPGDDYSVETAEVAEDKPFAAWEQWSNAMWTALKGGSSDVTRQPGFDVNAVFGEINPQPTKVNLNALCERFLSDAVFVEFNSAKQARIHETLVKITPTAAESRDDFNRLVSLFGEKQDTNCSRTAENAIENSATLTPDNAGVVAEKITFRSSHDSGLFYNNPRLPNEKNVLDDSGNETHLSQNRKTANTALNHRRCDNRKLYRAATDFFSSGPSQSVASERSGSSIDEETCDPEATSAVPRTATQLAEIERQLATLDEDADITGKWIRKLERQLSKRKAFPGMPEPTKESLEKFAFRQKPSSPDNHSKLVCRSQTHDDTSHCVDFHREFSLSLERELCGKSLQCNTASGIGDDDSILAESSQTDSESDGDDLMPNSHEIKVSQQSNALELDGDDNETKARNNVLSCGAPGVPREPEVSNNQTSAGPSVSMHFELNSKDRVSSIFDRIAPPTAEAVLIRDLLLMNLLSGTFDARVYEIFRIMAAFIDIHPVSLILVSQEYLATDFVGTMKQQNNESQRNKTIRRLKIAGVAVGIGALTALTAGLAAPAIAAGFGALGIAGTSGAVAFLGTIGGSAAVASVFGAGTAGLTGWKYSRRIGKLKVFQFDRVKYNKHLYDRRRKLAQQVKKDEKASSPSVSRGEIAPVVQPPQAHASSPEKVCLGESGRETLGGYQPIDTSTLSPSNQAPNVAQVNWLDSPDGKPHGLQRTDGESSPESASRLLNIREDKMASKRTKWWRPQSRFNLISPTMSPTLKSDPERPPANGSSPGSCLHSKAPTPSTGKPESRIADSLPASPISSGSAKKVIPKISLAPALTVTICVTGWLRSLNDVWQPWQSLEGPATDVYALRWDPDILLELGDFLITLLSQRFAVSAAQYWLQYTIAGALSAALMWPVALIQYAATLDNTWMACRERAVQAGKLLAEALCDTSAVGTRPVTLIGFSMGARVIHSCLLELYHRGAFGRVADVVLMGAPVTCNAGRWRRSREVVSGRLINVYSRSDWVLAFMFRYMEWGVTVAGLGPVRVAGIENVDSTGIVRSHAQYADRASDVLAYVGMHGTIEQAAAPLIKARKPSRRASLLLGSNA